MKTTQSLIGNAFKIVWEKFNKLIDETVLRNILVTLLKESIPTNASQQSLVALDSTKQGTDSANGQNTSTIKESRVSVGNMEVE